MLVPAEIPHVAHLPRLDQMSQRKGDADQDAETADDNVGDAEERIAPTDPCCRAEHDALLA